MKLKFYLIALAAVGLSRKSEMFHVTSKDILSFFAGSFILPTRCQCHVMLKETVDIITLHLKSAIIDSP